MNNTLTIFAISFITLLTGNIEASEFKRLCLGFGPSIDLSQQYLPLIHIHDPYVYQLETDKLDRETGLVYEEVESCTGNSNGFREEQISSLQGACDSQDGTFKDEHVEDESGIIPLVNGLRFSSDRQKLSCMKNPRNATPEEIINDDNGFKIIPLNNNSNLEGHHPIGVQQL